MINNPRLVVAIVAAAAVPIAMSAAAHGAASTVDQPRAAATAPANEARSFTSDTKQKGLNFQQCRNKVLKGGTFKLGKPAPAGSSLKMLVTHTNVLVKSNAQFKRQRDAYKAAGIRPWAPKSLESFSASYCGKRVSMMRWLLFTQNTGETYGESGVSYFEIWRDMSKQPNFFKDFASTHPVGFGYQGMIPADRTLSAHQVIQALKAQRVPVIMRWDNQTPAGRPYTQLIIKLGAVYAEVEVIPGIT